MWARLNAHSRMSSWLTRSKPRVKSEYGAVAPRARLSPAGPSSYRTLTTIEDEEKRYNAGMAVSGAFAAWARVSGGAALKLGDDVGCGPGGILELLAERVGPRGRVVGQEVDPVHFAMARELVAEQGLTNVEVI
jgi:SAM-dependent methyltransferase